MMEFECGNKAYNVIEFHDSFHDKLPVYVKVRQGYHGDVSDHVFSTDQVILIQAVSKQKRVLAKFKSQAFQGREFSFPSSHFEKFSIVKYGKVCRDKFLFEILRGYELPITVRYPKDKKITGDKACISTNAIPQIELLETFEESYLLGNLIADGVLSTDVIKLPLYLPQLKLSVIRGIKGQRDDKWRSFCAKIEVTCSFIEFDQEYGNQGIAEYDPADLESQSYMYVAPLRYSTIVDIMQRLDDPKEFKRSKSPLEKDENPNRQAHHGEEKKNPVHQEQHHVEQKKLNNPKPLSRHPEQEQFQEPIEPLPSDDEYEVIGAVPKPSPPASPSKHRKHSDLSTLFHRLTHKAHGNKSESNEQHKTNSSTLKRKQKPPKGLKQQLSCPELPQRGLKTARDTTKSSDPETHSYGNIRPRAEVQPSFQLYNDIQNSDNDDHKYEAVRQELVEYDDVRYESEKCEVESGATKSLRNVTSKDDVSELTIGEVGSYLRKLGLEKYESIFREHRIDGIILRECDKEILNKEFGIKGIEALRLLQFARDGHVPM